MKISEFWSLNLKKRLNYCHNQTYRKSCNTALVLLPIVKWLNWYDFFNKLIQQSKWFCCWNCLCLFFREHIKTDFQQNYNMTLNTIWMQLFCRTKQLLQRNSTNILCLWKPHRHIYTVNEIICVASTDFHFLITYST